MKFSKLLYLLLMFTIIPSVYSMGLRTTILMDTFFFEPNMEKEYYHTFVTNSGFTEDYELYVRMDTEAINLTKYVTIDKYYVEDVPTDSAVPFTVYLKLPEKIDVPGYHIIKVGARETQSLSGGQFGVRTGSEATITIIVLFPYKYVEWSFNVQNCNVNESCNFQFKVVNLGEPTIEKAFGKVEIYDPENRLVKTVFSDEKSIAPSKTEILEGKIDTTGMNAGAYKAIGILYFDDNKTQKEAGFLIGKLFVDILDHKKLFIANATEKMDIRINSGWNSKIENIYADVEVLNKDNIIMDKYTFRTVSESLEPWASKSIYGYFATSGLEPDNYTIRITLNYEGATTVKYSTIQIVPPEKPLVEEKPFLVKYLLNTTSLLILGLFLLLANILWMISRNKKKKKY